LDKDLKVLTTKADHNRIRHGAIPADTSRRAAAVNDALLLYGNQAPKETDAIEDRKDQIRRQSCSARLKVL